MTNKQPQDWGWKLRNDSMRVGVYQGRVIPGWMSYLGENTKTEIHQPKKQNSPSK